MRVLFGGLMLGVAFVVPAGAQDKPQERTFQITVTGAQAQVIVDALEEAHLPHKRTNPVLMSIMQQVNAQARAQSEKPAEPVPNHPSAQ